jgi:hypothetical protein
MDEMSHACAHSSDGDSKEEGITVPFACPANSLPTAEIKQSPRGTIALLCFW